MGFKHGCIVYININISQVDSVCGNRKSYSSGIGLNPLVLCFVGQVDFDRISLGLHVLFVVLGRLAEFTLVGKRCCHGPFHAKESLGIFLIVNNISWIFNNI